MIAVTEDIEALARLLAEKSGSTPQQEIRRALEARAAEMGLAAGARADRRPGRLKGSFEIPSGLFDPLPADELDLWWNQTA